MFIDKDKADAWLAARKEEWRKKHWTPEYRAKMSEQGRNVTSEQRAERMKKAWSDPERRAAASAKIRQASPEDKAKFIQRTQEGLEKKRADPVWAAKKSNAHRKAAATAEYKANHAAAMRKRAADPEWRAKQTVKARMPKGPEANRKAWETRRKRKDSPDVH